MIRGSLYEKYVKERAGCEILEQDFGFISYKIENAECFIADMFVDEPERKKGRSRELMDELSEIAIDAGCLRITANIFLNDKNANQTLIAALLIGFNVISAGPVFITIEKILEGESWEE